VRRTCERPGCGEPVAVIYGCAIDASDTVWVDAFSPDKADGPIPVGTMGVVCALHGSRLSAPRGWSIDDRRVAVPPLFRIVPKATPPAPAKPALEQKVSAKPSPKSSPDATGSKPRPTRKDRTAEVPRPSLFADLEVSTSPANVPAPEPDAVTVVESVVEPVVEPVVQPVVEPINEPVIEPVDTSEQLRIDDSTELEIQQDVVRPRESTDLTGDATRPWIPTFDPDDDLNGLLDATTPMLRDAFRSRHNGRGDRSDS